MDAVVAGAEVVKPLVTKGAENGAAFGVTKVRKFLGVSLGIEGFTSSWPGDNRRGSSLVGIAAIVHPHDEVIPLHTIRRLPVAVLTERDIHREELTAHLHLLGAGLFLTGGADPGHHRHVDHPIHHRGCAGLHLDGDCFGADRGTPWVAAAAPGAGPRLEHHIAGCRQVEAAGGDQAAVALHIQIAVCAGRRDAKAATAGRGAGGEGAHRAIEGELAAAGGQSHMPLGTDLAAQIQAGTAQAEGIGGDQAGGRRTAHLPLEQQGGTCSGIEAGIGAPGAQQGVAAQGQVGAGAQAQAVLGVDVGKHKGAAGACDAQDAGGGAQGARAVFAALADRAIEPQHATGVEADAAAARGG